MSPVAKHKRLLRIKRRHRKLVCADSASQAPVDTGEPVADDLDELVAA